MDVAQRWVGTAFGLSIGFNLTWILFSVMAFILGLPCLQIILFCWAIGHDANGLKIAVANHELNNTDMGLKTIDQTCPVSTGCDYKLLSCRYLSVLKERSVVYVRDITVCRVMEDQTNI